MQTTLTPEKIIKELSQECKSEIMRVINEGMQCENMQFKEGAYRYSQVALTTPSIYEKAGLQKTIEWVNVSDDLPEGIGTFKDMSAFVDVAGTNQYNEKCIGIGRYCNDRKQWFAHTGMGVKITTVTHWQPRPMLPKI